MFLSFQSQGEIFSFYEDLRTGYEDLRTGRENQNRVKSQR